ncbi:hypothetical protein AMATHDRAFT_160736 [Amanita thiersii Skay4041]|uniref:Uncharacterized protein n=1 Tax=Amanita thiersii Skay4041 TaxID=703135 RepID=A0A2A9NAR2_9AGAR|nr:hypothetical protein AMATHDRAFT_160736 [Amanita thiersii Skay4041]
MVFPIHEAQITGIFVESVFFGIHIATFGCCLQALVTTSRLTPKPMKDINWPMIIFSLVLFSNAAFDLAIGFYHNLRAFVYYKGPGGPTEELTNISDWVNVARSLTVVMQTMIGDAMLIYRCWVMYGRSFTVVSFSVLLWLGAIVCTILVTYLEATLHSRVLISARQLRPAGTAFWAITIAINVITTSLLVWRIWTVERESAKYRVYSNIYAKSMLGGVIRSIIESGLLYTFTALITFVTFLVGSNAVYVVTDAEIQIVGIAFNLLSIRAARLRKPGRDSSSLNSNLSVPIQFLRPRSTQKTEVHVTVTADRVHDDMV